MHWWRQLWSWLLGDHVSLPTAKSQFERDRAQLQEQFFQAASTSGKPRGLLWKSLDWEPGVEYVREKQTGRLASLVGVNISFEAVEGSDMEGLPAVGLLRNATGVFFYHRGHWYTTGKVLFNLNPDEVLTRFAQQYQKA